MNKGWEKTQKKKKGKGEKLKKKPGKPPLKTVAVIKKPANPSPLTNTESQKALPNAEIVGTSNGVSLV